VTHQVLPLTLECLKAYIAFGICTWHWDVREKLMENPTVSFVIPCYRLAHFLAECLDSILSQSYRNIEMIILDDHSPDNTADVGRAIVASHPDRRIVYIRNRENLGNICNYNKGIRIVQGKYVWILSPDDRLRSQNIVEKYVRLMESDFDVGFIFCPGHRIEDDHDVGLERQSLYRKDDQILNGQQLVKDIVDNNFALLAPSVMIRRKCYEEITLFPKDMPHRGDSYVWSLIAMEYKVGYFAEAMVDYRVHDNSLMSTLMRENPTRAMEDDIAVAWRVKAEAEKRNLIDIVNHCWKAITRSYIHAVLGTTRYRGNSYQLAVVELESSLAKYEADPIMRSKIRAKVLTAYGDYLFWENKIPEAREMYQEANASYRSVTAWAKLTLLRSGRPGILLRYYIGMFRQFSRKLIRI
jgi:glycosyltransferase involved in cell wall biosynthesis